MSRLFVIRCKDELEPTWHLLHSSGNTHSVTYNQYLVSPTLLAGWMELREFHRLNGNHQVTLTHYGQSVFLFTIFKSNSKPKVFPKWHSLYHQVLNLITFKVLLTEYKVTCNSFVSNETLLFICQILISYSYLIWIFFCISGCVKYHVLIYESCKIHSS